MSESSTESGSDGNEAGSGFEARHHEVFREYLDEHDYAIFRALNEDGRMSDTELAERVGLSRTAVRRRREKLQDEGVLDVLAVIVLQEADLAYADVHLSIDRSASSAERDDLIRKIVDDPLVYAVDSYMGQHDLRAAVSHTDLGTLQSYVWDLLEGETVVDEYTITPVVKTWKAWDKTLDRPEE